jgi:chemotaxis signal transduction protein
MTGVGDLQNCEKYCVFQRGDNLYAVLATAVREVGLRPAIALVPDSHPLLAGLGHLRNEFVPLLVDRDRSDHTRVGLRDERQVVVISGENGAWGLLVDRVVGLVPLEVSLCGESRTAPGWSAAVMGAATLDHRVVRILDERSLYRSVAETLNGYWTRQGL